MFKPQALLLFLALPAFAQQQPPSALPPMTFPVPAIRIPHAGKTVQVQLQEGCPVSIAARPHDTPQSVWVTATEDGILTPASTNGHFKTGVRVRLSSLGARTMTHLTLDVLYRLNAQGVMPVKYKPNLPEHKTFELDAADVSSLSRNLQVGGNVDIQRISVVRVAFSDGSTWQADATDNRCSVKPSHMILVASR